MSSEKSMDDEWNGKLPNAAHWTNEGIVDTDYDIFLRPSGKLNAVMIFVDFPNALSTEAEEGYRDTKPYFDWFSPATENWYSNSSFGALQLIITPIHRWFHMSRIDADYGFERGLTFDKHAEYVSEAVKLAAEEVDFALYDLVYIVPSKNATAITFSPAYIDQSKQRIVVNGTAVVYGATIGQDMWRWGYKVLVHETSHTFGLPDLYAFEAKGTSLDIHYYVGGWDVMGDISGHASEHLGWHKWKLGWLKDNQVDVIHSRGTTNHVLTPIELPDNETKLIVIRIGETSAYVVESRRSLNNDINALDQGVLIYIVNSGIETGYGPIQIVSPIPGDLPETRTSMNNACFGKKSGKVSTFSDPNQGIEVNVLRHSQQGDYIEVKKWH
ncbi:M6 family metalloprotease domain-containing protein [Paenibacillus thermotolerans]|uniref:M6 family metalloprotease domain-containing protein n=1 Tax=Paenibacillus thermotolerans TaxID=3027807 RepID=UPI0023688CA0|nr:MULTISPECIES: M6 family metalloprotease domain-containing protein [unclassified Paenibacillus]